jgi:hypothetical protein
VVAGKARLPAVAREIQPSMARIYVPLLDSGSPAAGGAGVRPPRRAPLRGAVTRAGLPWRATPTLYCCSDPAQWRPDPPSPHTHTPNAAPSCQVGGRWRSAVTAQVFSRVY